MNTITHSAATMPPALISPATNVQTSAQTLLKIGAVSAMTGITVPGINQLLATGNFPKPTWQYADDNLARVWHAIDIAAWQVTAQHADDSTDTTNHALETA
ncbi:MAG: hypothetical protein K2X55_21490 [Burkholderiaceae bacterium]|nr:hypothetical protein [Burkholderiaceae bacterium]